MCLILDLAITYSSVVANYAEDSIYYYVIDVSSHHIVFYLFVVCNYAWPIDPGLPPFCCCQLRVLTK